jgi:hypothetical protein
LVVDTVNATKDLIGPLPATVIRVGAPLANSGVQ